MAVSENLYYVKSNNKEPSVISALTAFSV